VTLANQLLQFSLFSSLSEQDLSPLLPYFRERRYRKGQILFVEGEIGKSVYFVLSGQVKLTKTLPDGEEQILNWCGPYDSFAEELLIESGSYPTTAEIIQESTLLVLDNEAVPGIIESSPIIALVLIRTLSRRLRLAQEFIRIMSSKSTAGILAALLLRMANPGDSPGQAIYVDATLTHRDLANMIGTSRECVNRSINSWKRAGILAIKEDHLEILKPQELADWP